MKSQKRFVFLIITFLVAGLLSLAYHLNILSPKKKNCRYSSLFKRKTVCHFDHMLRDLADRDKHHIRETVLKIEPHIKKKQGIDLIFSLRDFTHRKVKLLKSQHLNFFKNSASKNFEQILTNPDYGHYCAGIALTYIDILTSFGFPSRYISLISKTGETHASVEISHLGSWIIVDPTFNISFVDKKTENQVSYKDLLNRNWDQFKTVGNGYQPLKGRSISEYYYPYKDLLYEIHYWSF